MRDTTRRGFLMGCSTAIAGLASARFADLVFADPLAVPESDVLIVLFLRGGMDGLSFVMPTGGSDHSGSYETARPALKIPTSGTGAALSLGNLDGTPFGLHPAATGLREGHLYQGGHLAASSMPRASPCRRAVTSTTRRRWKRHAGRGRRDERLADPPLPDRTGPASGDSDAAASGGVLDAADLLARRHQRRRLRQSRRLPLQYRPVGVARRAERPACATSSSCSRRPIHATPKGSSRSMPRPSSSRTCRRSQATCRPTALCTQQARSGTR